MIAALLLLLSGEAHAGDDELRASMQRQEAVVDALAADVAAARVSGAARQELAARMTRYRTEAERLAVIAAPLFAEDADVEQRSHADAARRLAEAVATDRSDDTARGLLVAWVGEPEPRVAILEHIVAGAPDIADRAVRAALALDLSEQAGTLALIARYDAAKARREEARASAQATALRARTAPGQSGGLDVVVSAERAERAATEAGGRAASDELLARRLNDILQRSLAISEASP